MPINDVGTEFFTSESNHKSPHSLIGITELAEYLKLDRRTVANPVWRERLRLPYYQINARCIRFDLNEVAAHLRTICHHQSEEVSSNAS